MRRAAKVDANQPEIVAGLRKAGAFVQPLHTVGEGVPDLLVCYRRRWWLLEVKDGSKPPSRRVLTADQARWHALCGGDVHVVETVEQALEAVGAMSGGGTEWALQHVS